MNKLLLYLTESGACLLVFYLLYTLILKRENSFQYNRFYLLLTPLLSFIIPLMELPFLQQPEPLTIFVAEQLAPITISVTPKVATDVYSFNWQTGLLFLYGAGVIFLLFRLSRQLYQLQVFSRKTRASCFYWENIRVHKTEGAQPTFSFWNCIYLDNSQTLSKAETERVLLHEAVHIRQKHSWDILYLEFLKIVFWFNPLLYLYQKALISTHEFIADSVVLRTTDAETYASLLARQMLHRMEFSFGNYFNKSLTFKRMKMLQQTYRRPNNLKKLAVLPVFGILIITLACAEPENPMQFASNLTDSNNPSVALADITAPQFPGGRKALYEYLAKNITIPTKGTGILVARTVEINENGEVKKQKVRDEVDSFYTEEINNFHNEVTRLINNMPAWQPATKEGKPIKSGYQLTFSFNNDLYLKEEPLINNRKEERLDRPQTGIPIFTAGDIVRINNKEIIVGQLDNTKPDEGKTQNEPIFTQVEQNPQFTGGLEKMYQFLGSNIKYPKAAVQANLEGMVVAKFQVTKEGKIKDIKIDKSLSPETDAEAKRVISLMPTWEPGKQNGKPVNVEYTLPIKFSLGADKIKKAAQPPKTGFFWNNNRIYWRLSSQNNC